MTAKREVKVFKTVDEIGKENIDSLADDGFFTYGYFKTVETSKAFDIEPLYMAVSIDDEIVAISPCYIESTKKLGRLTSAANFFGFNTNHIMASYSPASYHGKLLFRENCDAKPVLKLMSKKIDEICKKRHLLFSSFPHVPQYEKLLIENLEDFGYEKAPSVNISNLYIEWSSFDDYLKGLESHKVRTTVRREIKKWRQSGITITEEKEFENLSVPLSCLHSNLKKKHEKNAESARLPSFFRNLSEYAKDKTRVLVAKQGDKIIGFSLSLQQNDVLDVHMCGFDYNAQTSTDFTYFNLVYYVPIRLAIEEGIKEVHFSINEDRVKSKRGCKTEKTYSFVKFHNMFLRSLRSLYAKEKHSR